MKLFPFQIQQQTKLDPQWHFTIVFKGWHRRVTFIFFHSTTVGPTNISGPNNDDETMSCQNKAKPNKKTNTYFFSKSTTRLENSTHGFFNRHAALSRRIWWSAWVFSPQPRNDEAQAVIVESCLRKRCNPIGRACLGTAWETDENKTQTAPTKNTQNKKDLPSAHRHEQIHPQSLPM